MKPYNSNMFESIKNALEKAKTKSGGGSAYRNLLQLEAPATYVVRLLPNIKSPEESILHYFHHGWNSISTGQYVSMVSPSTWGDRCPISELYFKVLRDGTDQDKERAKANLRRKENWLVNVLVVNDPKRPENNGTIKVLRYGRQLDKIIQSAIKGDDAEEFGARIFDLSPDGCNLRIKVELVSDKPGAPKYPTYTASKFLTSSSIEGFDEDKIAETYNSIFDLNTFVERKSADDIKLFINEHYYDNKPETEDTSAEISTSIEEEDVPYEAPAPKKSVAAPAPKATVAPAVKAAVAPAVVSSSKESSTHDDKVAALLDGLDDLT